MGEISVKKFFSSKDEDGSMFIYLILVEPEY